MLRVPYTDLYEALHRAMLGLGLREDRAALSARLIAETTRDGVYTHGLNRFPRFEAMVLNGSIDIHAEPTLTAAFGSIERWNGNRGIGNLNAYAAINRAITLAKQNGVGGVALGNTSHWMRGGTYGWLAAEAGLFSICWSNTLANLPAWGATTPTLGNNPLVIAIPRANGHVILDMACPNSPTEPSPPTPSATSPSPSTAASTLQATSPATPRPSKPPSEHSPSATGKAPASPSSST